MGPLTNEDVEYLRKLDALFTSDNETVKDLIDQAITVQGIVDPDKKAAAHFGPFQKLIFQLQNMNTTIARLERDIATIQRSMPLGGVGGGYWPNTHPTTVWTSPATVPLGGQYMPGTAYTMASSSSYGLTQEELKDLIGNISLSGTTVEPADPNDPDAYSLYDPDTGDTMTVKSK